MYKNYRGISLLATAGKILSRIILNRLIQLAEEVLPESQHDFRSQRWTIAIFCARQLQEKSMDQRRPLLMIMFDLSAAFDSVPLCVIAQILFSMHLAALIHQDEDRETAGLHIQYRSDGAGLFNLNWMKSQRKTFKVIILEIQYADGNRVPTDSPSKLQTLMMIFTPTYEAFGLKINNEKCRSLYNIHREILCHHLKFTCMTTSSRK